MKIEKFINTRCYAHDAELDIQIVCVCDLFIFWIHFDLIAISVIIFLLHFDRDLIAFYSLDCDIGINFCEPTQFQIISKIHFHFDCIETAGYFASDRCTEFILIFLNKDHIVARQIKLSNEMQNAKEYNSVNFNTLLLHLSAGLIYAHISIKFK